MKTGFICASGFNVVVSAQAQRPAADRRGARRAAPAAVRAVKAAQLLEQRFRPAALSTG